MNSKQRRKEKRTWKYEVEIPYDFEDEYMPMFEWCQKNFGPTVCDGWRNKHNTAGEVWQFDCDRKAALFALRWKK